MASREYGWGWAQMGCGSTYVQGYGMDLDEHVIGSGCCYRCFSKDDALVEASTGLDIHQYNDAE